MNLTIYTNAEGFDALRSEWNALLTRSRANTLFLTWEWQTTWWRCLGEGDLFILAWHDAGALVGIAPLYYHPDGAGRQRFDLVGCVEVSDYLDLICASGYEQAVYDACLAWLLDDQSPSWDEAHLCNLAQNSLSYTLLPERAAARGLHAVVTVEDVCPLITLPDSFESYLQEQLSKKQRHEIRRKLRRVEEDGRSRWYVASAEGDISAATDAFLHLHRLSDAAKNNFMTSDMERFFRTLMAVMQQAGWLHLAFIEINGDKAATMLCFIYEGRVFVYNSGYDPTSYAELSPGIVLTTWLIEDAIARGLRCFDFLQGNEVYKYRFGAQDTLVYSVVLRHVQA
ncbi:MAG: GNAT family N-acetyltransferase [Caldilineales bacterium]